MDQLHRDIPGLLPATFVEPLFILDGCLDTIDGGVYDVPWRADLWQSI